MPARNLSGRMTANQQMNLTCKAMSGDIALSITPATVTTAAITGAWTRNVTVKAVTAAGEVHEWLNAAYATKVSVGDTSTAGTATIASTTLTLVNGRAEITVTGSAHEWAAAETDTLTIASIEVLGYTVAGGTSVETFA